MTPSEQGLSDLIHQRLKSHRDSILMRHQELCGDVVPDDCCGPDAWQRIASNMAIELKNYAALLEALSTGLCPGPVVFPSWDEGREDGPFGVIADAHKDGCTNPAVFNCTEDAYRMAKAAPAMLAALKACRKWVVQDVEHFEDGGDEEWAGSVPLLKKINKAITKAEGGAE